MPKDKGVCWDCDHLTSCNKVLGSRDEYQAMPECPARTRERELEKVLELAKEFIAPALVSEPNKKQDLLAQINKSLRGDQ